MLKNLKHFNILFFLLIFSFFSILSLYDKGEYLFIILLSLINAFFIIWFLTNKYSKNFIVYIYFIYGLLTLKIPIIIIFYGYSLKEMEEYFKYLRITKDDVLIANIYIFVFDIILVCFLFFFFLRKKTIKKMNISRVYWRDSNKMFYILFFLILAYTSKLYLMSTGIWYFYEMNSLNIQDIYLASYANILEKSDILVLLYFVYKYKIRKLSKVEMCVFISILIVSILFALPSTSKGKILTLLVPVFIMLIYTKNKIFPLISSMIFISLLSSFFNTMMYLRVNPTASVSEAILTDGSLNEEIGRISENKVLARINYQVVLSKVFKTYPMFPEEYKFDYVDNFIGLIPRALWKDKPVIGMDMNKIGYEIGMLHESDDITSVGITPIGIAYYELGVFGIPFIALFTAILLLYFSKLLQSDYWIGFILSIMIAIQLARNGTYTNIVPSLFQIIIVFFLLGTLLANRYSDEKKIKFKL